MSSLVVLAMVEDALRRCVSPPASIDLTGLANTPRRLELIYSPHHSLTLADVRADNARDHRRRLPVRSQARIRHQRAPPRAARAADRFEPGTAPATDVWVVAVGGVDRG